jgi:hypothetical protein
MRKNEILTQVKSAGRWYLLAALPLASGAALIVHILTHVSLGLALLGAAIIIIITGVLTWRHISPLARRELIRRSRAGLMAGLLAVLAYDSTRWVTTSLFHDTIGPFEVFPIFGRAIGGADLPFHTAMTIGVLYHVTNGLLFAIAYAILLGPRGWWTGILWGLGLETLMLTIYPGWLHLRALGEFATVSMLGHVAYGLVLGVVSQWNLARQKKSRLFKGSSRSSKS